LQLSENAKSLLRGLLERRVKDRLGSRGVEEVKASPFFASLDFAKVLNKEYPPEFRPPAMANENDVRNFDTEFTDEKAADSMVTTHMTETMKEKSNFEGFTYQASNL
jgi:serum/glucocorticoid-regulated kinase 2